VRLRFRAGDQPVARLETLQHARAIEAGAHGIVVSREYEEMEIEHLRAVGRAMRV
jgi:hypothetical protein